MEWFTCTPRAPGRSHRPARAVLVLGLAAGVAGAQVQGTQPGTWLAGLFGSADRGDPARWSGGIDRGGTTRCRLGNCSTPTNCVFNLSAREEILRSSYCMEEHMERPYLGASPRQCPAPHGRCLGCPTAPRALPRVRDRVPSTPAAQRHLALPRVRNGVPSTHRTCLPPRCVRVRLDVRGCGARAGKYIDNHAKGVYTCGCCNTTLFHSSDKFDSRRGYLSFWSQAAVGNVGYKHHEGSWFQHPLDTGLHCEHCGAHLGLPPDVLPAMSFVACLGDSRGVRTLRRLTLAAGCRKRARGWPGPHRSQVSAPHFVLPFCAPGSWSLGLHGCS